MLEQKPLQPTDLSSEDKDKFNGLQGKYYPALLKQKVSGLYEKLSAIKAGEVPVLTQEEKEFFIELIMANEKGMSNIVRDVSCKIWGARSVDWEENGKYGKESTIAALWWHFCSSRLSRVREAKLIDFFFGTTKEQAETEIATWKEWEGKTHIK